MDDLIIFSSPIMCVLIGLILFLHVACAFLPSLFGKGSGYNDASSAVKISVWVMAILNAILHFVIMIYAFLNSAEPTEMLLVIMLSSAVAMTAIGIKEKNGNGK